MTIIDRRELERLRHTPGEALLSRDFRDQAAIEAQMRWWHTRAAHGAFGVALGLRTRPVPRKATPPAAVRVPSGLAYDAFGREVLVAAQREVPLPATPPPEGSLTLVLRYRQGNAAVAEDLTGVCLGSPRPREEGELAWIAADSLAPADGVPLARIDWKNRVPVWDPDFQPPNARAFARQRIGSGSTVAGGTAWESWAAPGFPSHFMSLEVQVDTRAAGFTKLPCYFAWVEGNHPGKEPAVLSLPATEHIALARATGFVFRTRLSLLQGVTHRAEGPSSGIDTKQVLLARRQLSVCWLGIQRPYSPFPSLREVIHGHP